MSDLERYQDVPYLYFDGQHAKPAISLPMHQLEATQPFVSPPLSDWVFYSAGCAAYEVSILRVATDVTCLVRMTPFKQ